MTSLFSDQTPPSKWKEAGISDEQVVIKPDGSVYVTQVAAKRRFFWQKPTLVPSGRRITSYYTLVKTIVGTGLKSLHQAIMHRAKPRIAQAIEAVVQKSAEGFAAALQTNLQSQTEAIAYSFANNSKNPNTQQIIGLLHTTTVEKLDRFRQEMGTHMQRVVEEKLSAVTTQVIEGIERVQNQTLPNQGTFEDVFPEGTRVFRQANGASVVVTELAPGLRTIEADRSLVDFDIKHSQISFRMPAGSNSLGFQVAFPYVILVSTWTKEKLLHDLHVYYRTSPLTSIHDELYSPNLPNIYHQTHRMCNNFKSSEYINANWPARLNGLVSYFWNSHFSSHLTDYYEYYGKKNKDLNSFFAWETASKHNPQFIFKIKWDSAKTTPAKLIQHFLAPSEKEGLDVLKTSLRVGLQKSLGEINDWVNQAFADIAVDKKYASAAKVALLQSLLVLSNQYITELSQNLCNASVSEAMLSTLGKVLAEQVGNAFEESFTQAADEIPLPLHTHPEDLIRILKDNYNHQRTR